MLLIQLVLTGSVIVVAAGECITEDGPTTGGKACIFPFVFDGVEYDGCPPYPADASETWCSTEVDSYGNHVAGEGEFGYCSEDCPKYTEETDDVDCNECVNEFSESGGCECLWQFLLDHSACNVAELIPEGCLTCSVEAMQHCAS